MSVIKDVAGLAAIRDALGAEVSARLLPGGSAPFHQILVCVGGGCLASGSERLGAAFREALKKLGAEGKAKVVETGCMGPCAKGPVAKVTPGDVLYQGLSPADAEEIVASHILKGELVARLLVTDGDGTPLERASDMDFFRKQRRLVLRNCGLIDPRKLEEYIACDGYRALGEALGRGDGEAVVAAIVQSGLRGRGGGGFPTGLKWRMARQAPGDRKNVVCNADEGDPGAFMDRSVLEGDPHCVLEGMAIAGFAIGAANGYVYVRAEYPLAIERLDKAIKDARAAGLLGKGVLGSGFDFDVEIRMGSGAFVCGEETALMASIEGGRGEPRPRPPFPVAKGLWGLPTLLNNVETFANVPGIVLNGPERFAALGAAKSKGTKVFALAGAINNSGIVEVPIGMQLGELVYDIGGGVPRNKPFKAAQIGGPSGGCVPKDHLDVPLDYEALIQLGAIMGSGGLVVMDEDSCMVDVARFFLEFVQEESCGKCAPCRVGTKRLLEILERICGGKGVEGDIERLVELGTKVKQTALCGLGKTAANPVLSTIRHFRHEYEAHIRDRKCPAGVCAALVRAPCQSACPAGVDVPGFVALVGEKRYAEALRLHRERNPFAAACARVCYHTCENHCRRASLDDSVAIRSVKRFMVDQEITTQVPEVREDDRNAQRKVVVVGAGPAGLSCAYFLARLGYKPKVYESESRPGGMMVQAIPAYRLPREILAREIRMVERLGVDIETNKKLGTDFTLASLRAQGCEAVFVAIGAPGSWKLEIPGEDAAGVVDALDFLRRYNVRGSAPVGKDVIVVGGGNASVDAARSALRLGAETVTIVYRRARDQMPAYQEEIEEAEAEGVQLRLLTAPLEVVVDGGVVVGLRCRPMRLGDFDRSGRRRPESAADADLVLKADQVITAISQMSVVKAVVDEPGLGLRRDDYIKVDPKTGQSNVPWLFAGGDVASGPASVINAVADGERAAVGIDQFLTGADHAFWRQERPVPVPFDPDADPDAHARERQPLIAVERRRNNFDEVELCWGENTAVRQAKRCLRCDFGKGLKTGEPPCQS